jgi:hypothetical protein
MWGQRKAVGNCILVTEPGATVFQIDVLGSWLR